MSFSRTKLVPQDNKLHAGFLARLNDVSSLSELGQASLSRDGGLCVRVRVR